MRTASPHRLPPRLMILSRFATLIVTVLMGAALTVVGVLGYRDALASSLAIAETAAQAMTFGLLRDHRRSGQMQASLDAALEDFGAQGLLYAASLDDSGERTASAGTARRPADLATGRSMLRDRRRSPSVEPVEPGLFHVFVAVPLGHGRGPGQGGGWRARGPRASLEGANPLLFLEMEPVLAKDIVRRARAALFVEVVAAALLLGLAGVSFRLTRRAEQYAAALAKDDQLRALGQMSAVIGHELRNPLTALKGHAQLLEEKLAADHPGHKGAQRVVAEARRLERLTNQVLDFARSGELRLEDTPVAALLQDAASEAAALPVTYRLDPVGSHVLDRDKMMQVLVNLLLNARQACPPEAPVEVSARLAPEGLYLEVADRGTGIAPGEEEKVFEPFVTGRVKGTGLGLALAKRIVEAHGGSIGAQNRPGGGARFTIVLPHARGRIDD